jgi:hypothetical protein
MPTPLRAPAVTALGSENWIYVPTIANQAAPTAVEVNSASGLDFTNLYFADGTDAPSQTTNLATAQRRGGDVAQYQYVGISTYAGGTLIYQFDPQSATTTAGRKLWEKIPGGTTGFLVRRLGIANSTTPVATNKVDVYPVQFGPSQPTTVGDSDSSETAATCSYAVTGPPSLNVALV